MELLILVVAGGSRCTVNEFRAKGASSSREELGRGFNVGFSGADRQMISINQGSKLAVSKESPSGVPRAHDMRILLPDLEIHV